MKILCISDTHNRHKQIPEEWLVPADIIIHAGDISGMGYLNEVENFCSWFDSLSKYKHKIFIGGNHDFSLEPHRNNHDNAIEIINSYKNIIYLKDGSVVIDGVKIFGSPYQPEFYNWAFNLKRGKELQDKWNTIPLDSDIICTHGPVYGLLDMVPNGEFVGCKDLLNSLVTKLDSCLLHICGHIHCGYGHAYKYGKTFVNASTVNEMYMVTNKPILIDFNKETKEATVIEY